MSKLWQALFLVIGFTSWALSAPYTYQIVHSGKTVGNERFSMKRTGVHLVMTGERLIEGSKGLIKTRYRITARAPMMSPVAVAMTHQRAGEQKLVVRLRVKKGKAQWRGPTAKDFDLPERTVVLDLRCVGTYFALAQCYDRQRRGRQSFNALFLRNGNIEAVDMDYRGEDVVNGPKPSETLRRYAVTGVGRGSMVWADKWGNVVRVSRPKDGFDAYLEGYRHAFPDSYVSQDREKTKSGLREVTVAIPSKGAMLEGTLTLPQKEARDLTGVVLVGDGGFVGRDGSSPYLNSAPILKELASLLSSRGAAVIRYDKRQLQETKAGNAAPGFNHEVEDVKAVLRYLARRREVEGQRMVIIGHGLGATVAAAATKKMAEAVSGLVLLAPFAPSLDKALNRAVNLALHEAKVDSLYRKNTQQAIKSYIAAVDKGENLAGHVQDLATDLALYRWIVREAPFLKGHMTQNICQIIPELSLPILVIGARQDKLVPQWSTFNVEQSLRNSANTDYEVKRLSSSKHDFAGSADFVKVLSEWFQGQSFSKKP